MKKNIILLIVLVLLIIGVTFVIGSVPAGTSYHERLYTNVISGADGTVVTVDSDTVLDTQGGLIIETCTAGIAYDCPTASTAETGQIWLETTTITPKE